VLYIVVVNVVLGISKSLASFAIFTIERHNDIILT